MKSVSSVGGSHRPRTRESRIKKLTSARNTSTRGPSVRVGTHTLYRRYRARRDVLRIKKLTYARNSHARILKGVYEVNLLWPTHMRPTTDPEEKRISEWSEPRLALARQVERIDHHIGRRPRFKLRIGPFLRARQVRSQVKSHTISVKNLGPRPSGRLLSPGPAALGLYTVLRSI